MTLKTFSFCPDAECCTQFFCYISFHLQNILRRQPDRIQCHDIGLLESVCYDVRYVYHISSISLILKWMNRAINPASNVLSSWRFECLISSLSVADSSQAAELHISQQTFVVMGRHAEWLFSESDNAGNYFAALAGLKYGKEFCNLLQ